MDNEDALKELKSIIETKEAILDYCKDFREDDIDIDKITNSIENLGLAIQALEKQIPKKPIYDSTSCPGLCPKCLKDDINILIMNGTEFCDRVDYCPNCGQKIDWD